MTYDDWRLASPYENLPNTEAIADYYGVELEEVTDDMLCSYEQDLQTDYALQGTGL